MQKRILVVDDEKNIADGVCYTIEENSHKRGEVQLQIEDIKPSEE